MENTSKPNLSSSQRALVAQFIFQHFKDGKLARGVVQEAAAKFSLNRKTVRKIWKQARQQMDEGIPINLRSKKIGVSRAKKINLDGDKLKSVKLKERGTVRGLASSLEVSSTTAWRWIKSGQIRSHTNAIHPELTADCKMARLKFCLNPIHIDRVLNKWMYKSMNHIVHIDEKWFYLTRQSERYYLYMDEEEPYRSCKSKKFITKIMFLCAVCRPIYNMDGSVEFDGKIGIFPFTQQVAAKRNSKRRRAGTMETKAIDSITKDVIKSCLINMVVPAIKRKWPLMESTNILIQQDNAKPHIDDTDVDFRAAASSDGFNIHLVCQPTNSPDLNINDLGWFRALQSLQCKRASLNIDQLVDAVEKSFTDLHHTKLNNVFLTLQGCMTEILKVNGHNNYKIPHMGKAALMRQDLLPENLEVEEQLVRKSVQYLVVVDEGEEDGFGELVDHFQLINLHTKIVYNLNTYSSLKGYV